MNNSRLFSTYSSYKDFLEENIRIEVISVNIIYGDSIILTYKEG